MGDDEQARTGLGEGCKGAPYRVGAVLRQGAAHDAEVHAAHDVAVPVGGLQQWTAGEPDLGGVLGRGLGREAQVVEEPEHLVTGGDSRDRDGPSVSGELPAPLLAGRRGDPTGVSGWCGRWWSPEPRRGRRIPIWLIRRR